MWVDTTLVRPGATVPVKVLVRNHRGDEVTHTVQVAMPVNATGGLTLLVADGSRLAQWEQRETRQPMQARRSPDSQGLQQGAQEQPPLHSPARRRRRRGRRRRAAGRPAAVDPGRTRRRSQQQRLLVPPHRHHRRVGHPRGLRRQRRSHLDAFARRELTPRFPSRRPVSHVLTIPSPVAPSCVPRAGRGPRSIRCRRSLLGGRHWPTS